MGNKDKLALTILQFSYILRLLNLFATNYESTHLNSCDNIFVNLNKNLYSAKLSKHCLADHIYYFLENFHTNHPKNNQNRLLTILLNKLSVLINAKITYHNSINFRSGIQVWWYETVVE